MLGTYPCCKLPIQLDGESFHTDIYKCEYGDLIAVYLRFRKYLIDQEIDGAKKMKMQTDFKDLLNLNEDGNRKCWHTFVEFVSKYSWKFPTEIIKSFKQLVFK